MIAGAKRVGKKRSPQNKDIAKTMAGRFGARLEQLAEKANIAPNELAAKIGKSHHSVLLYYAGKTVPHINDWPVIAKALGVSPVDLVPR